MALFAGKAGVLLQSTTAKQVLEGKTLLPAAPEQLAVPAHRRSPWHRPLAKGRGFLPRTPATWHRAEGVPAA